MDPTQEASSPSGYAGPREEKSTSFVLVAGLVTTGLTLLGIYILDRKTEDFHIMGWYANYILPVGALLVGLAASSGYGLASWFSGIRITRKLLWTVVILQVIAYFAAQYIEFKGRHLYYEDGKAVGFFEYFDWMARSFAWQQKDGSSGEPMGAWGYAFRGLEISGFCLGSLIVPAVMLKVPYCQECQRYMRTKQLNFVPGSVPVKKIKKSDEAGKAAHATEQQNAFDTGKAAAEAIQQLAAGSKTADFQKSMSELSLSKKQTMKLPIRFSLQLVHCKRCYSGWLSTKLLVGQGKEIKQTDFSKADLHPEFVRAICQ